ncbi:MAG: DUF4157 domain-containing protein, partial [Crocosphaera sp.]
FNPSQQTSDGNSLTPKSVVQRQEGTMTPTKSEEEQPVQKQASEEEQPVQKQASEEEQPVQKQASEEEQPVQKQEDSPPKKSFKTRMTTHPSHAEKKQEQIRSLPHHLKTKLEALSGFPMDDVRVHYNSSLPAQIGALAYTQGTEIHIAPGQEKHLPHEAWHVVQQKQGRVQPTLKMKGIGVNDNSSLEQEATAMGQKAN